jgi:hypothetical protein
MCPPLLCKYIVILLPIFVYNFATISKVKKKKPLALPMSESSTFQNALTFKIIILDMSNFSSFRIHKIIYKQKLSRF